jgi:hypothetical protein
MFKYLFFLLLISSPSLGQQVLSEYPLEIPKHGYNKKFISTVTKKYSSLVKEQADSVLLFYQLNFGSNYAVLFWKEDNIAKCRAFYQFHHPWKKVQNEILDNDVLKNVNIKSVYDVLMNKEVRALDTSVIISHDNPIYCQFNLAGKEILLSGYSTMVKGLLNEVNSDFINEYGQEEYRITSRETSKGK